MLKFLVALPLVLAAAPVIAQDAGAPAVRVSYADLNLASPAGRAELDRRVEAAVRTVCEDAAARDLRTAAFSRGCRATVRDQIAAQRERAVAAAGQTASVVR